MATASAREGQPIHEAKAMSWSKVFGLSPAGPNWPRGVMVLDVALVPLIVFWAIGHEEYLLSALFGVLFAMLADPGGAYGYGASRTAVFALIGAGLTALGFGIGGDAWGWLVLAAFAVTLVAGLAVMFGVRRLVTALLLNIWFIVALAFAFSFHHHAHISSYTWAQVLAWSGGSALWIAVTFRFWNYALYTGAIAAGVLILVDLPQPSNYGAEGYRVLWTLCGAGSPSSSCSSPTG
jgi:hypothetical protein